MIRQIISLTLFSVFASFWLAYSLTTPAQLAGDLVAFAGEQDALRLASYGATQAFAYVFAVKFWALLPWMALGAAIAVLAYLGLWKWSRQPREVESMTLHDEAGGTVKMYGVPLNHDPGIHFMAVQPGPALYGATEFEAELMGVIYAHKGIPNDPSDPTIDLATYVAASWTHIVAHHGAGSLASMLAIAYHVGKVMAYEKQRSGWVAISDKFGQQSCVVVRRVPSFYRLPVQRRDDIVRCLAVLSSDLVPIDLPDEMRSIIRDIRIADLKPSSSGKAATDAQGTVDVRKIATVASSLIVTAFARFNVNQSLSKSDALDALFVKKDLVLLVPPRQMREAFAAILPEDVAATLQLSAPAAARHPSDPILRQVLESAGHLVPVYKHVGSPGGTYAVRSGQRKFPTMWALSAKSLKQEIIDSWGDWPFDIEILGQGEIHAA